MTPTCRPAPKGHSLAAATFPLLAGLAALAFAPGAARAELALAGEWDTNFGRIRLVEKDGAFTGTLLASNGVCPLEVGSDVMKGTLLDDSFAGKLRICVRGKTCKVKEEWASAVFLAGPTVLSGAIHVEAKGCFAPVGKKGGIALKRASGPAPTAAASPAAAPPAAGTQVAKDAKEAKDERKAKRAKAREVLKDGAAYLNEGSFEAARRRFLEAIELDEGMPEAFNGVGVTWRMRNDLARALEWYKKALVVDPDFGDAYYNMACVYALQGEKEMALRYLQIAALNGYASGEGIDADPDLESLRADPAYQALLHQKM